MEKQEESPQRRRVAFIGCSSTKARVPCIAERLYRGVLFRKSLAYCRQEQFDAIYVLSAKYGLVALDERLEPYDLSLRSFSLVNRRAWAERVKEQMHQRGIQEEEVWFFCGKLYHEHFMGSKPMQGKSIGRCLAFFNERTPHDRNGDVRRNGFF